MTGSRDPGQKFQRRLRARLDANLREMPQDEFDALAALVRENGRGWDADLMEARRSAWRQLEEMRPKAEARLEQMRRPQHVKPPGDR